MNNIPQKYRSDNYRLLEFISDLGILGMCYDIQKQQFVLRMNNDEPIRIPKVFADEYLRLRNY